MKLKKNTHYFLWFYFLTCAIVVGVVGVGLFFPQILGIQSIDEWPTLFDVAAEKSGVEKRGSALMPFVHAAFEAPGLWAVNVYAVAPTIAAIVMAAVYFGRRGLRMLLSRLRPWRNGVTASRGLRVLGWLIATMAGIKLCELGLGHAMGLEPQFALGVDVFSLTFVWFYLSAMFLDQGGLLEETGWRGYATPILQSTMSSPLKAALFLGFFWAAWHLPREIAAGHASLSSFLYDQFWFFAGTILLTIIIHFFFNRLGGSTLSAIAVHGLSNDSVGLGGSGYDPSNPMVLVVQWFPYVLAVAIILAIDGSNLGMRDEDRLPVA